ncbi:methyltransferase domain-containing protein [Alphaproteobacteria bacterium]|nr:methyltransferase domain-containing protein [Alphaproteobacteria bacterium]
MANTFNQPSWFWKMINQNHLKNDDVFTTEGIVFKIKNQIPRLVNKNSENQEQTSDIFGFKCHKRDTFENNITKHMGVWLKKKYGELGDDFLANFSEKPNLLDAGCGGAMLAMSYFEKYLDKINYVGVDISNAVDIAAQKFLEKNIKAVFLQCNLTKMPFKKNSFDIIFSEGVLHHTDNTFNALKSLCEYLKINGKIYFYIYKKFHEIFKNFSQLKFDLSILTYKSKFIEKCLWNYDGIRFHRFNYNWEDDSEFWNKNFDWAKTQTFGELNIFNFHPIHISLNSSDKHNYENLKQNLKHKNLSSLNKR